VIKVILIRVVVAGSRGFNNYELLKSTLNSELQMYRYDEIEIVSGGADGADKLGETYAQEGNMKLTRFIPDWDRFGDSAGHRRNVDMAYYGDWVFCFWDGVSSGTRGMINVSKRAEKIVYVTRYEEINDEKLQY
jgi:hypothetical protein